MPACRSPLVRWPRGAPRTLAAAALAPWAALALAPLLAAACERAQAPPADRSPVRFHRAPAAPPLESGDASLLERLGYLTGYRPAAGPGGVSVHDPTRAFAGLNLDRKSTRLNSSHLGISYAVFCLKKKKKKKKQQKQVNEQCRRS